MTPRGSPSAGRAPWEAQGTTSEGWENGVGERGTSSALIHDSEAGPQTGAGSGKTVDSSGREKSGLGARLGAAQAGGRASGQGEAPSSL